MARGNHATINQDEETVVIETPYDDRISALNQQLNDTYIPYGDYGLEGQQRQLQEDSNAATRGAGGTRGASKASAYYRNGTWDLVDALADDAVDLGSVETEALPPAMQNLTLAQRQDYVEQKQAERQDIQNQIQTLYQQRQTFIAQQQHLSRQTADTFQAAMTQALKTQLAAKGFTLDD
jgi:hypothetical protein